jgi:hypothetical protein
MKRILPTMCCAMMLKLAAPAQAFTLPNGVQVKAVDDLVFEVVPRSSGTLDDFWCGASEYARRVLGAGWRDTIYVYRGRGISETTGKRSAVQFTLSREKAPDLPPERGVIKLGLKAGDSMSVQMARGHCNQRAVRP